MKSAIELHQLTKAFSANTGVFALDLAVERGRIFGFLGPNGSGKTTTIRMMLSYLRPDSGQARLLGLDCQRDAIALRHRIGYLPAEFRLYERDTGWGLLRYLAHYRPAGSYERAKELAERLHVDLNGRIKHYSKGMKQKLALIQALMHDPELLILDEPTDGFDPLIQQEFHQMLIEARARGRTIFLSSHVLSEVEQLCDQVGIIRQGRLLTVERIEALRSRRLRILNIYFARELDAKTIDLPNARFRAQHGQQASFSYSGEAPALLPALEALPIMDFTLVPARLEDIFMEYYA
ncbi:MAG TPA: ABC transporter ATP-binding protein [Oscillatoriaceae cyanobacterium]